MSLSVSNVSNADAQLLLACNELTRYLGSNLQLPEERTLSHGGRDVTI